MLNDFVIKKFQLLINRINLLTSITIDFAIFILLCIYLEIISLKMWISPSILIYIFEWIVISYIIGRYSKIKKINKSYAINQISKSFFLLIFMIFQCTNLEYLGKFNFFFNYVFCILSTFSQYFFNRWIKTQSLEKWYFIGDQNILNIINEEIKISNNNIKINSLKKSKKILDISSNFQNYIIIDKSSTEYKSIIEKLISNKNLTKVKFINITEWCEFALERYPVSLINKDNPILRASTKYGVDFQYRIKRVGDIVVSLFILFTLSPLIIFCCLLIFIEDRGPVLYIQKRIGFNSEEFNIIKLRTMRIDAEIEGPKWATNNDKRITNVGRFLRKSRIDELPQLINVLRGKMSLIGPRPERAVFETEIIKHIPHYNIRHRVLPGISGWAQVNYPYGSSLSDAANKLSYDLYYYRNFSLMLDTIIFIKTIKLVLNSKFSEPIKSQTKEI